MTWTAIYEGQNSVEEIIVKSNDKTTKIFSGYAQPVFNQNNSLVALPYCEDGGCQKEIRIIDLVNVSEKKTIELPQTGQLEIVECKWESINILRIRLQYYNQQPPMEAFFVYNAHTEELKLEKERIYDPLRRD
jgi:hypothetical protein